VLAPMVVNRDTPALGGNRADQFLIKLYFKNSSESSWSILHEIKSRTTTPMIERYDFGK